MSVRTQLQAAWLRRGWLARILRPLSWLYRLAWALRSAAYAGGLLPTNTLPVPVVVVGNLIAGGAGKTPTTMALVAILREQGFTPGIVSRGYRRQSGDIHLVTPATPVSLSGDEPLLMHLRTSAPVVVGADRDAAGRLPLTQHPEVDVLVCDDGLQHRRLARQAQVIVFDERGAGNGWLLPAGPLREPMPAAVPARSVVVYNAPSASTPWPGTLAARRLGGVVRLQDWWDGGVAPSGIDTLAGRTVLAAAGLAHPRRFFDMLRAEGLSIAELALADHGDFDPLPWPADTPEVVVTEKDAVKLPPGAVGATRVWVATLDFTLDPAVARTLLPWMASARSTER